MAGRIVFGYQCGKPTKLPGQNKCTFQNVEIREALNDTNEWTGKTFSPGRLFPGRLVSGNRRTILPGANVAHL